MIQPFLNRLANRHIVLASGSPRRKEILENIGLSFVVIPSTFEENLDAKSFPSAALFVEETAKLKAIEVANSFKAKNLVSPDLIISADTVVLLDNNIIGKPKNEEDAISILHKLNGRTHLVHTCLTLALFNHQKGPYYYDVTILHDETEVKFSSLTDDVIKAYVKSGEPLDKAGAYGIQGIGGSLIEWIHGDYFNVVGFPLNKFYLVPLRQIIGSCLDH